MSESISELLNIEIVDRQDELVVVIPLDGIEEDIDFKFARANHYLLAQQSSAAMTMALRIARESEDVKAIEALSKLLKAASDVNRQLLNLSKDRAEVKTAKGPVGKQAPSTQITANNVVFAGNSKDLNKLLKEQENENS